MADQSSIERCIQFVEKKVCETSVTKQARAELAQLSRAVEAAQNQYVYTAAQMESERFKSKVEGSNEVLLAVLYELGYTPPEDEAIGLGRVKRELNRKLEEAQGAILEAAAKLCDEHNRRLMEDWDAVTKEPHLAEKIRALQTEPMAAALAARDERIRAEAPRLQRQKVVMDWCVKAFGDEQSKSLPQRCIRLLEESIEAYQSVGCDEEMAHKLVSYVFSRPTGELAQELGGVGLVLLSIAEAANLDADSLEQVEVERVLSKPIEHFTKRNLSKNESGFAAARKETL